MKKKDGSSDVAVASNDEVVLQAQNAWLRILIVENKVLDQIMTEFALTSVIKAYI